MACRITAVAAALDFFREIHFTSQTALRLASNPTASRATLLSASQAETLILLAPQAVSMRLPDARARREAMAE